MAECTNFSDCVVNPIEGLPASDRYSDISSIAVFSINAVYWVVSSTLIVLVAYFLVKTIYSLYGGGADTSETYERFRKGVINAVFAVFCFLLVANIRFLFVFVLNIIGVPVSENIFGDLFPF